MKRKPAIFIYLFLFLITPLSHKVFGQIGNEISVSLTITPPYSPYFEDYINFEGAILMLQNNTAQTQNIQLKGSLEGDNGLYARTSDAYLSPQPLQLNPYETVNFYSNSPVFDFMDMANVESNISQELQDRSWRLGVMPEGNYTICVQAFDYNTGAELSPSSPIGCTVIPITLPQPPEIINPLCESTLEDLLPSINWTPVIGNLAGANILYDLYIVRLQPALHGIVDPYYAMELAVDYNAGNPLIIRDQQITSYLYGPSDPPLVSGATYAMQVIAHDANNLLVFENDGKSDVCTFTYQMPTIIENKDLFDNILLDTIHFPVKFYNMTSLSGQMFYKFNPSFTGLGTLQSFQVVEQNTQSNFSQATSNSPQLFLDNFNVLSPLWETPYPEGAQYFDHDLLMVSSNDNKLAWTQVRLVTRYIHNSSMILKNTNWLSTPNTTIAVPTDNGKVLSTTMTDGEGNYNFNFIQTKTGHVGNGLFRVITLEVVSPYFYSPDIKILTLPGDQLQLPNQAALVRTYNLNVNVRRDNTPDQYGGSGTPIAGVEVNVRGDYHFCQQPLNQTQIIQSGTGPNNTLSLQPVSDIDNVKTTNTLGWVTFNGLVRHNAPNVSDRLVINASTPGINQVGYMGKPILKFYPSGNVFDPLEAFTEFDFDFPKFNSDKEVESYDVFLEMQPDNPKIFGRVLFDAVPLEGTNIQLWAGSLGIDAGFSDSDGYFLFDKVLPGTSLELLFSKAGFPTSRKDIGIMQMGQYLYYEHNMIFPGEVFAYVSDERGDPVMADVKFGEGDYSPYISTEIVTRTEMKTIGTTTGVETIKVSVEKARFQAPAYEGENIPLEIIPRSDKYFPHTFFLNISNLDKNTPKDIGEFIMFEKLHRIQFNVVTEVVNGMMGYIPVPNAKVEILEQDLVKYTDNSGQAYFKYASPGSYFWVKVTPPEGSDYTPFYEKMHLPISKHDEVHTIILEKGYTVNGIVTAGPDSIPLPNARVFIKSDFSNGMDFVPLLQTFSKSDGSFELRGIPFNPSLHTIHAVKSSPDTAFVGDFVLVSKNTPSPVFLNLEILDNLNLSKIWEMAVEVEDLYYEDNKMFISGAFVDIVDNQNFQKTDPNTRLAFYNIEVLPSNQQDQDGNSYLEPNDEKLPLGMTSLPIKVQSFFFGEIVAHTIFDQTGKSDDFQIKVLKDESSFGYIKGIAELDLSSFKFSYDYNASINLANDQLDSRIRIFTADPDDLPHQSYFIGEATKDGFLDLSYSVHEFYATADRKNSLIYNDTVSLFTILHTNVPNCIPADLEVEAGYIKIIPTDILQIYGGDALSFKLEDWDVIGQEAWTFDKNQGGIVLPKARINTHIIDLDVDALLIKPDDLKIDQASLTGKVNLAGITNIDILPGNNTVFHYDNNCSSDFSPHWRFSVLPISQTSNTHVGEIAGLPGMDQSAKIEIGKFSLFSNDESQMDQFDQTITFYQVFDLKLDGNALATFPNSFELHGTYDLHIPNLTSNYPAILQFSKPENQLVMNLLPPYLEFATIGNVNFKADQTQDAFNFGPGLFEALGTITITDQGNEIILRSLLTRSLSEIKIDIIQVNNENQRIAFEGQVDKYLEVMEGKMEVFGNVWEKLWFDGATIGLGDGVKDPYDNLLHFVAHGSVNVDDGAVEVTGVETPFGEISITIDFVNMSFHGSLSINTPITAGYCTFKSGCGELQIDGSGFYFGLGLTIHILSIPVDIDAAIIVGYYPTFDQHLQDLLNDYSYRNQMPDAFGGGVQGFLFSLSIVPIDISEEVDVGIAYFSLEAHVGLNFIFYATFTDPPSFGIELIAFAGIGVELSFLCVDLGLFINAELMVGGQFVDNEVDLIGCGSLQLGIYYDVCELVADCFSESLRLDLAWGTSTGGDLDMEASLGGGSCSGNSGFNSDHNGCD